MKTVIATSVALLFFAGLAHAQQPKPCGFHIEIENKEITDNTQKYAKCNHGGKVRITVTNLDAVDYLVKLKNFSYKPPAMGGGSCYPVKGDATAQPTTAPFERTSTSEFQVDAEDSKVVKGKIDKAGDVVTGCLAFDIFIYTTNNIEVDHLDPDLEVTEPGNPPPAPPAKPKPQP